MLLNTGKLIHSYNWESLPISDDVITCVEDLAEEQNQSSIINLQPLFEWSPSHRIDDEIPTTIQEQAKPVNNEAQEIEERHQENIDDNDNNASTDESVGEEDHNQPRIISDDVSFVSFASDSSRDQNLVYPEEHNFISEDDSHISYSEESTNQSTDQHPNNTPNN